MPLLLEIVVCHRGHLCSAYFPLFDAVPVTGANVRRNFQERIMDRAQS